MKIYFDVDQVRIDVALKGMNQSDLAKRARLSRMTISRFLSGQNKSPSTAKKVARALGQTVKRYLIVEQPSVARGA